MATTVTYRFRVRRRTTANWASINEVLLDSEIGLESDLLRRSKIGDGVTGWNSLPFYTAGLIDHTALESIADGDVLAWDATSGMFVPSSHIGDAPSDGMIYGRKDGAWEAVAGGGGGAGSGAIGFSMGNSVNVIVSGVKGNVTVPFDGTIKQVWLSSQNGQVGSVVLDIWKDPFASIPPTVTQSITASAKPTIVADNSYHDATLTGWDVDVLKGDNFTFVVDSVSGFTYLSCTIEIEKS